MASPSSGYANFKEHERNGRLYTGGRIDVTHDGANVVCMCGEELKLVDVETGTVVGTVSSEGDEFTSFVVHPEKMELVSASRSRQIRHTSLSVAPGTCEVVRTWKAHKMPVTTMAYDATGSLLATGSADMTVMVFNVAKGFCTHVFKGHEGVVHKVIFHPDAERLHLFSSCHDNSIRVWDLRKKRCLARLGSHVSVPAALAFSPDGGTLLSGGRDQLVCVWRLSDFSCVASMAVLEAVESLLVLRQDPPPAVGEAALCFVTAGEHGLLACWDARTKQCLRRQPMPTGRREGGREGGKESPGEEVGKERELLPGLTQLLRCGDSLLAATADHNLLFYRTDDLAQARDTRYNRPAISPGICPNSFGCFSPQFSAAACAGALRRGVQRRDHRCQVCGHRRGRCRGGGCGGGGAAASGGRDQLRAGTRRPRREFAQVLVRRYLAAPTQVRLFSLRGMSCRLLVGHRDLVLALDASADGALVATASKDATVRVWDAASTACVAVCVGHVEAVGALAFGRRAPRLLSGSKDKTLKLWDLQPMQAPRRSALAPRSAPR